MTYLLFLFYLALLLWVIPQVRFFKKSALAPRLLQGLFFLKVAAGVAYGYFHAQRGGGDTWVYHHDSVANELPLLRNHPLRFFTSIFDPGYATGYGDFFGTYNSWWNNLDNIIIPKTLALLNLLSGSNYYINSLFFNLFSLAGTVLLVRVFKKTVPAATGLWLLLPFLAPSFIFWTSGIHKEGMLVLALGLVIYPACSVLHQLRLKVKYLAGIVVGLLLVLVMRNFLLLPLAGALLAWAAAHLLQKRVHPLLSFIVFFSFCALVFFGAGAISPSLNFPQVVIDRQEAFNGLSSANRLQPLSLQPTAASFLKSAPAAFTRGLLQPLPAHAYNLYSGLAAAESILILLFLLASFFFIFKSRWRNPLLLFCLFFSLTVLLTIGFTVVFPGAMVRYRSMALPLLLMPPLAMAYPYRYLITTAFQKRGAKE